MHSAVVTFIVLIFMLSVNLRPKFTKCDDAIPNITRKLRRELELGKVSIDMLLNLKII